MKKLVKNDFRYHNPFDLRFILTNAFQQRFVFYF